jgi:hypothetical protein
VRSGVLSGGTFTATYPVTRLTTFTAVYAGGATYGPTSRARAVKVHARVVTKAVGSYGKSHGYALFHVGKNPRWLTTVSPNHSGECTKAVAQKPTAAGAWRTFGTLPCVVLSTGSQVVVRLTGTHVVGEKVRIKAVYGGNAVSLGQTGAWSYVRFTR